MARPYAMRFDPSPAAVAMALVIGATEGASGERLFLRIRKAVARAVADAHDRAHDASRKGWLEYRSLGSVTEVDLTKLLAEASDIRLPLMG